MTNDDKGDFFRLIADVMAFYRRDFSEFAGMVWWGSLQAYDLKAISDAFQRHCMSPDNGQFMPAPGEIIRMLTGTSVDSSMVAWSEVDKAVRSIGTYESVVFCDALIHRVISDMGGWIALGTKTEDEWPFVGKEFQTRYKGYASRGERPDYPRKLIGMAEAQNTQLGFRTMPPRLIGDPDRARLVYQGGSAPDAQPINRLEDAAAMVAALMIERTSQSAKDAA